MEIIPDPEHQADATRRDRALNKEIQAHKIRILRRPQKQSTYDVTPEPRKQVCWSSAQQTQSETHPCREPTSRSTSSPNIKATTHVADQPANASYRVITGNGEADAPVGFHPPGGGNPKPPTERIP
jgi:hypothetical protein